MTSPKNVGAMMLLARRGECEQIQKQESKSWKQIKTP